MRTALTLLCAFTMLASLWLFAAYLTLRHPGFETRAAIALLLLAVAATTLVATRLDRPALALRVVVLLGAAFLAVFGAGAIVSNHRPGADFEGFADVIGLALLAQGLLTIGTFAFVRRRPASG